MKAVQKVRDYILEDRVGEGGMGAVYRARHALLDRPVAIKVMSDVLLADTEFEARFLREAKAQARLQHPYIVGVTDFFSENGRYYLVMPLVEGHSLEDYFHLKGKPLSLAEALSISANVLSALDYAHQRGVIHRDVKPSNILLDAHGQAYLVDFGIALMVGFDRKTRTGISIGTPHYMSPEQIRRPKDLDHRTDVYSFGCVLYEMLTGHTPFEPGNDEGDTDFVVKEGHVNQEPMAPRTKNAALPAAIDGILLRALAKRPDERFSGCGEFARALAQMETTKPFPPVSHRTPTVVEDPSHSGRANPEPVPQLFMDQQSRPSFGARYKKLAWILPIVIAVAAAVIIFAVSSIRQHRNRQDADNYNSKGLTLFEQKKYGEAEAAYRQAITLFADDARYHGNLSKALYSQEKYAGAEAESRQALTLDPNNADYHNDLGKALLGQNNFSAAEAELRKAIVLGPKEGEFQNSLGLCLKGQKKFADAESAFKQAIALNPKDGSFHYNYGNLLTDQQKHAEAEAENKKAVNLDPNNAKYQNNLGVCLRTQNKNSDAEAAFKKAVDLEQNNAEYHYNLADVLLKQDKFAEAEPDYQKAVWLEQNNAKYNNGMGVNLWRQKKYEEAEAAFRKATEIEPNNAKFQNNLGIALSDQQQYAEAEAAYRKAVTLEQSNAGYHYNLGDALFKQDKFAEAEPELRKAAALEQDNALNQNYLGVVLDRQKKYSEAEAAFRKAVALQSNSAMYHTNLGITLERQSKYADAEKEFKTALFWDPNYTSAKDHLQAVQGRTD